ncbi:hypothetical protein ABCR94_15330 [Streptomyces sp. 21So2-11]|uniref:rhamnogalacturonan endolyase family protein n=1 Tax=Streptomyces sp. 21So2-11 TaxID=3144408 RepID=UPI00321A23CC
MHPHRRPARPRLLPAAFVSGTFAAAALIACRTHPLPRRPGRQAEALDRGVVSVHTDAGNLVSRRWLGTDADSVAFNVYRAGTKLNPAPIASSTNYFHSGAPSQADYTVRAVVNGVELA